MGISDLEAPFVSTFGYIWNGHNQNIPSTFPSNSVLGFSVAKGISFDLQAMEAANPGSQATQFSGQTAIGDIAQLATTSTCALS